MENFIVNFVNPLLQAVFAVVVPLVAGYLVSFIKKKTGIAVAEESRRKLEEIALKAVMVVEEKALSDLKGRAEKWTAYQKRKEAVDRVLSFAPTLTPEQAGFMVEWAVAHLPGVGASNVWKANGGGNAGTDSASPATS